MIIYVDQFYTEQGDTYSIAYDTSLSSQGVDGFIVTFQSNGGAQNFRVSEQERGRAEGAVVSQGNCEGNTEYKFYASVDFPFATVEIIPNSTVCQYVPPSSGCDLDATSVSVTNAATQTSGDGIATVIATSTHNPILYSLNNVDFQNSNLFQNLPPGNYTAYVKDALYCQDQIDFVITAIGGSGGSTGGGIPTTGGGTTTGGNTPTVPTQTFIAGVPVVIVPNANISRWNAAFNPIVHSYQRKDFTVEYVQQVSASQILVSVSTAFTTAERLIALNDALYFKTTLYNFYGLAAAVTMNLGKTQIIINTPFLGNDGAGFLNLPNTKPSYQVQTEITSKLGVIVASHSSDMFGYTRADISSFLQQLVSCVDTYDFVRLNYLDPNQAQSYTIRYREYWDGGYSAWFPNVNTFYVTNSAMQLQEEYGGNMAKYLTFPTVLVNRYKALWLTDMVSPTMWLGLPFELSFIYSEQLANLQLELETTTPLIYPGALLQPDGSYIVMLNGGKILINRIPSGSYTASYPIAFAGQYGIYRLKIPQEFISISDFCTANVYYLDENGAKVYIMQPITIKVKQQECEDPFVYLKWVNHLGAWDYWRFGFNQTLTSESTDSVKITRYVSDWQNQEGIEDYISRSANDKLAIGANGVDKDSLVSLRWMNNSIKVQRMVSKNPFKWQTYIIPDGSFSSYETRKGTASVKINLVMASKNIQQQ